MSLENDLDWLERLGHAVTRIPTTLRDGRAFYHVDGLPRTSEQIEQWALTNRDPVAPTDQAES